MSRSADISLLAAIIVLSALHFSACTIGTNDVQRPGVSLSRFEREVHEAINDYRDSIGLSRFGWSDELAEIARSHSVNMADGDVGFGHSGSEDRVEEVSEIYTWESLSENVAYSSSRSDLADFFLRRWLESSQHRKNIIGTFNTTGIGAAINAKGHYYVTQIFILID